MLLQRPLGSVTRSSSKRLIGHLKAGGSASIGRSRSSMAAGCPCAAVPFTPGPEGSQLAYERVAPAPEEPASHADVALLLCNGLQSERTG